jgi:hypothetical protein
MTIKNKEIPSQVTAGPGIRLSFTRDEKIEQILRTCSELWLESEIDTPEWGYLTSMIEITKRHLKHKKGCKNENK